MTRGLQIREADDDDFATLLSIDQACFDKDIAYDAEELAYYIDQPGATTLVGEIGETIVAFLLVDVPQTRLRRSAAVLITLDVVEDARGHGIGDALLDALERRLVSIGVERYRLQVDIGNERAIAFYRKNGFRSLGTLEDYYGEGRDAYLMEKNLRQA